MTQQDPLPPWPALAGLPRPWPAELLCERGVLGKAPGGDADFHWIAASPGFSGLSSDLDRQLVLGAEDVFRDNILLWRSDARMHQAVHGYPGSFPDAQGRAFLEKQALEWQRPAELPAALGALALLPLAATLGDSVWQGRPRDPLSDRLFVALGAQDAPRPPLDPAALAQTLREGLAELRDRLGEADLATLYARLLAGHRGIFPPRSLDPLGPAALAALLLPLPREIADRISVAGWLPSTFARAQALRPHWDLILGGDCPRPPPDPGEPAPGPPEQAAGLAMAQAVGRGDPSGLARPASARTAGAPAASPPAPTRITLWGPSGSGKTVFLAQLFWQLSAGEGDEGRDWDIFPGERGLDFFESMRERMYSGNAFPPGTPPGTSLDILCHLRHRRTGETATLALEDRAGADYESHHEEVQKRLAEAHGIVLLLDPRRRDDRVFGEVAGTFERLLVASGRLAEREPRPVAVCVTKADELIETPEDYRLALSDPDAFARQHVDRRLLGYLESRFERFALFPASAAGVRMRFGAIEPVVFYDEALRPRIDSGRPFNLLAPVDWLIGQLKAGGQR